MILFRSRVLVLLSFVCISLAWSHSSFAHSRGESFSKWNIGEDSVGMQFTIKLKDVNKLGRHFQAHQPGWQERFKSHVLQGLNLFSLGEKCKAENSSTVRLNDQFLKVEAKFVCKSNTLLKIRNEVIFPFDARHMHIARVYLSTGEVAEKVLLKRDNEWQLTGPADAVGVSGGSGFYNYLIIGMEHIITGWDHLAFLAALLMLVMVMDRSLRTLLVLITGFSIGHSCSLILMVLGYLSPNGVVVESLIALSIMVVAFEIIAVRDSQHLTMAGLLIGALALYALVGSDFFLLELITLIPLVTLFGLGLFIACYFGLSRKHGFKAQLLLTVVFGLIHGFGFAGSLQEIGLPADQLLWPLLGFNLGVELGQVALVLMAILAALPLVKRFVALKHALVFEVAASVLCAVGCFWFVERSFA